MSLLRSTQRRPVILLASLGAVALGFLLPGAMEQGARILHPPTPEPTLSPAYLESRATDAQIIKNLRYLGKTQHWDHIVTQVDRHCGQNCTMGLRAMRAEALTRLHRDAEAVVAWKTVYTNLGPAYDGPLLLLEGRTVEYDDLCRSLLAGLPTDIPNRVSTRTAVWLSLLVPRPPNPERLLTLARYADPKREGHRQAGGSLLSAAFLRAGKPEEALRCLEPDDFPSMLQLRALRALALRRQGRLGEALQEARLFRQQLDETFGTPSRQRVELLLFLRELDSPPVEGK